MSAQIVDGAAHVTVLTEKFSGHVIARMTA